MLQKIQFIAATLFLTCTPAWSAVGGRISGTITDASGAPVAGVRVTVTNTAQGIQTKATSDTKGIYKFPTLAVGRYDLKTEAPGFKPQTRRGLTVHVDGVIQMDLVLEAADKAGVLTDPEAVAQTETPGEPVAFPARRQQPYKRALLLDPWGRPTPRVGASV